MTGPQSQVFALDASTGKQSGNTRRRSSAVVAAALLRPGQPRRGVGDGMSTSASSTPSCRARPKDRQGRLEHPGRRPAGRLPRRWRRCLLRRPRLHGHLRRGKRDPRPRHGLRRQDRPRGLALLHDPRPGRTRPRHLARRTTTSGSTAAARSGRPRPSTPTSGCCTSPSATPAPTSTARARRRQPVHRLDRRARLQDRRSTSGTSRKSTTTSGTTTPPARPCSSTSDVQRPAAQGHRPGRQDRLGLPARPQTASRWSASTRRRSRRWRNRNTPAPSPSRQATRSCRKPARETIGNYPMGGIFTPFGDDPGADLPRRQRRLGMAADVVQPADAT